MTTDFENFTLKIVHDDDAPSPRADANLGTFAGWHRKYNLGDVQPKIDPMEYQEALPANSLIVPVYMFDHGSVALSTKDFGDRWDSGQVGIYHLSPERIAEEYGVDTPENRALALDGIKAEISKYSDYLNGNCWGYEIEDADGNHVDSYWGFIGSDVLENGLADNLPSQYLPLLEAAVAASEGATCDSKKLEEWKARVEVYQASQRGSSPRP
jgi:hypothetical protein